MWNTAKPEWLIWIATREGVLSDSDVRLFACWSVRQVWHLLTDEPAETRSKCPSDLRGESTQEELAAARAAAGAAARDAALDAAWAAAWAAARDAADGRRKGRRMGRRMGRRKGRRKGCRKEKAGRVHSRRV